MRVAKALKGRLCVIHTTMTMLLYHTLPLLVKYFLGEIDAMNKTIEALFGVVTETKELYKPLITYGEREGRIEKVC